MLLLFLDESSEAWWFLTWKAPKVNELLVWLLRRGEIIRYSCWKILWCFFLRFCDKLYLEKLYLWSQFLNLFTCSVNRFLKAFVLRKRFRWSFVTFHRKIVLWEYHPQQRKPLSEQHSENILRFQTFSAIIVFKNFKINWIQMMIR